VGVCACVGTHRSLRSCAASQRDCDRGVKSRGVSQPSAKGGGPRGGGDNATAGDSGNERVATVAAANGARCDDRGGRGRWARTVAKTACFTRGGNTFRGRSTVVVVVAAAAAVGGLPPPPPPPLASPPLPTGTRPVGGSCGRLLATTWTMRMVVSAASNTPSPHGSPDVVRVKPAHHAPTLDVTAISSPARKDRLPRRDDLQLLMAVVNPRAARLSPRLARGESPPLSRDGAAPPSGKPSGSSAGAPSSTSAEVGTTSGSGSGSCRRRVIARLWFPAAGRVGTVR
jgi:hypothetical protein